MLDIKFLRENPDVVKQNIKNGKESRAVDAFYNAFHLCHFQS